MVGNFLVRMATFRFESRILLPGFGWLEFSITLGNYNLGLRLGNFQNSRETFSLDLQGSNVTRRATITVNVLDHNNPSY